MNVDRIIKDKELKNKIEIGLTCIIVVNNIAYQVVY